MRTSSTVVFGPTVQSNVTKVKKVLADELQLEIEVHRFLSVQLVGPSSKACLLFGIS